MTTSAMSPESREAVQRLAKDIRSAAESLSDREARFLVDSYYAIQTHRIEAQHQVRALGESEEPNAVVAWLFDQHYVLEREIAKVLGDFGDRQPAGRWSRSITGIGPIIAAGLLAHIDIEQAPTVGHIWRFAGLDPTTGKLERGVKRPWNARLKVVCWKAGESFVKVSTRENDVYGKVYAERKAQEIDRNEKLLFKDQAELALKERNYSKSTDAYKWYSEGKLPPARIHARAKRYAVKLFLAHWHEVAFVNRYKEMPPKPYVISHMGHTHFIAPPDPDGVYSEIRKEAGL